MQQVLFWIPIKNNWWPEGIPVYAYGAMLFLTFIVCVWFIGRRALRLGMQIPREKFQDLAIFVFIAGLIGARLTYKWQFGVPWNKFVRIWEGGIVLYGGIIGGALAFILFWRFALRRFNVSVWQLGDLVAPAVALGIAIGRVGCLLNGCCWGDVAPQDVMGLEFPLLTCPSREMLVDRDGLQTAAGFSRVERLDDVRSVVGKVEPDSPAAKAGLMEGDKILKLKLADAWLVNGEVLYLTGPDEKMTRVRDALKQYGAVTEIDSKLGDEVLKVVVEKPEDFAPAYEAARTEAQHWPGRVTRSDVYTDLLGNWPRGRNSVQFIVERQGAEVELPAFTPRTLGLYPTQVYETISMLLIVFLLLAFYPFRRHDGQVWVLFMVLYAAHRFLNEILRTEPIEAFGMTLSQIISGAVLLTAIALEIYLRATQRPRTLGPTATAHA
jgi:phosphatidylglycerol---prolipoprotein diacylglyceryl transferase